MRFSLLYRFRYFTLTLRYQENDKHLKLFFFLTIALLVRSFKQKVEIQDCYDQYHRHLDST